MLPDVHHDNLSLPLSEAVKKDRRVEDPSVEKLRRPTSLTAGIVRLGRVGRRGAECLQPLVAGVLYYDPYVSASEGGSADWKSVGSLPELVGRCQIVSLHVPLSKQTHDLIDIRVLAEARALILVNTSRADLLNREALETALAEGQVSFFGSDVFWQEPPDYSNPGTTTFLRRRDVLVTPHMAWCSEESEREVRRKAAEEVLRFLRGEQLLRPVQSLRPEARLPQHQPHV